MSTFARLLRRAASRSSSVEASSVSGERTIASAEAEGGRLVATDRSLRLPGGVAVGWEYVARAWWDGEGLCVRETAPVGTRPVEHRVRVPEPGWLPEVIRERVTATIVVNQYARLRQEGGVRVVGRRRPGTDEVLWTLMFDSSLDPADDELRARAESLLTDIRRQTGF